MAPYNGCGNGCGKGSGTLRKWLHITTKAHRHKQLNHCVIGTIGPRHTSLLLLLPSDMILSVPPGPLRAACSARRRHRPAPCALCGAWHASIVHAVNAIHAVHAVGVSSRPAQDHLVHIGLCFFLVAVQAPLSLRSMLLSMLSML